MPRHYTPPMTSSSDEAIVERQADKPEYVSPKLVKHGDVRELTLAKNAPQSEAGFANGSLP